MAYPTRTEAENIWRQSLELRDANPLIKLTDEYIAHTKNVAFCAEKIAEKCGLDSEKAYLLGLLHDYGKVQKERLTGVFHGRFGYEYFLDKGYDDVARICLTHSFIKNPINKRSHNFNKDWLDWANNLLKDIEYNDYDRLIQLCDLFGEALELVTLDKRFGGIAKRYGLSEEQKQLLMQDALLLKEYFDNKCGCDVYSLLGLSS
ncbi:MAG: HD domain-containing protein [Alphaproteobacteria bacterium]